MKSKAPALGGRFSKRPPDSQTDGTATAPGRTGEIAILAYQFWQERGCPEGCPEEDWFRAERELHSQARTSNATGS